MGKNVTQFKDKNGTVYDVKDTNAREDISDLKSQVDTVFDITELNTLLRSKGAILAWNNTYGYVQAGANQISIITALQFPYDIKVDLSGMDNFRFGRIRVFNSVFYTPANFVSYTDHDEKLITLPKNTWWTFEIFERNGVTVSVSDLSDVVFYASEVTDTTLKRENMPADGKAVGQAIDGLSAEIAGAVKFDSAQELTSVQKQQARTNIESADASEVLDIQSAILDASGLNTELRNKAALLSWNDTYGYVSSTTVMTIRSYKQFPYDVSVDLSQLPYYRFTRIRLFSNVSYTPSAYVSFSDTDDNTFKLPKNTYWAFEIYKQSGRSFDISDAETLTFQYSILTDETFKKPGVAADAQKVGLTMATKDEYKTAMNRDFFIEEYENVYSAVNGAYMAKALDNDHMNCTGANIKGTHNACIYVYNDKIYLGYLANKIDETESHVKYNCELTITNLSGNVELSVPIISPGDSINGTDILGCQAIAFLPVDGIIHIYADLVISENTTKFYHIAYDIVAGTFGTWGEVSYIHNGVTALAEKQNEQYIAQSWFTYGNYSHTTAVYFDDDNFGIAYTNDFLNFNFIISIPTDGIPVGAGGEVTAKNIYGRILVAYRAPREYMFLVFKQYDIATGKWGQAHKIPDASSRPMFFEYDNGVYLLNNAPYSREDVTLWKYHTNAGVNADVCSMIPLAVAKLPFTSAYFSVSIYNDEIYYAGIEDLKRICVSKIQTEYKDSQQINSKILDLFQST